MILLVHLLFGALIGQKILNPFLAVILAYFSHYFLDFLPHDEYSIENLKSGRWGRSLPDFTRVFLDLAAGIILIFIFSAKTPIIFIASFFAILPDGLSFLGSIFNNALLTGHSQFHQKKVHYFRHKKIPYFWRVLSQALVVILCMLLLRT